MRRIAIGSIAIVLLASLQCEPQETKAGPLTSLRQAFILVEPLTPEAKTVGLSRKSLESQLLVGLRRDIPGLAIREGVMPFLNLMVFVLQEPTAGARVRGFSACISLRMMRPVTILGDGGVGEVAFTVVAVWDKGALLGGSRRDVRQQVKDTLDELLTLFAADYYRQNSP